MNTRRKNRKAFQIQPLRITSADYALVAKVPVGWLGRPTEIPNALRQLISASSPEEAGAAYWKLENRVFIQSGIYEAALPTASVIIAAFVDPKLPKYVVGQLLEVLFHVVNGAPREGEEPAVSQDFAELCKSTARLGLWVLYRIYQEGLHWQVAGEIIDLIEDTNRLTSLRRLHTK